MRSVKPAAVLLLAAALLPGCAGTPRPAAPVAGPVALGPLKPGDIVETRTGRKLDLAGLTEALAGARLVYVGEVHANPRDHEAQQKIIEALHSREKALAVGLEMFPRKSQGALDRYAAGALDEAAFLRESDWAKAWGFPFRLYRPILVFARENGIPLLALNAPPEVISKIGKSGMAALLPEERRSLAEEMDTGDEDHKAWLKEMYDQHPPAGIRDFEAFHEAQTAWEETMAESVARFLAARPEVRTMVVLLGQGHMVYGFGVPDRVERRMRTISATVLPAPENHLPPEMDPELADYLYVTEKWEPPAPHGGRMGVLIRAPGSGPGLEVVDVLEGGAAAKGGMRKGDVIVSVDGTEVNSTVELHQALLRGSGARSFTVLRGGERATVSVTPEP